MADWIRKLMTPDEKVLKSVQIMYFKPKALLAFRAKENVILEHSKCPPGGHL
jgi:hypothetical protein